LRLAALFAAVFLAVPAQADELPAHTQDYPGSIPDLVLGKADAPNTIIEYSSLTCPHCAGFHTETLPKIKKELVETGKAKLVYRDFPLDGVAMGAAMLARCMPVDRYFPFLDMLFSSQKQWAYAQNPMAALQTMARLAGLSDDRSKACMTDQATMAAMQAKQTEAEQKYKINSTPQFVVNGKVLQGALPYDEFVKALGQ
jgi:protein-disulfide isomerase